MNVVTVKEAKRNLDALIEKVFADAEPALITTETGQQIVLVPAEEFNSWRETAYLLSNPANAEHLRKSIREVNSGQYSERKLTDL